MAPPTSSLRRVEPESTAGAALGCMYVLAWAKAFFGAVRRAADATIGRDVKKVDDFVDDWWNARAGVEARKDLVSSGSLETRRPGPWRTVMVNDIAVAMNFGYTKESENGNATEG